MGGCARCSITHSNDPLRELALVLPLFSFVFRSSRLAPARVVPSFASCVLFRPSLSFPDNPLSPSNHRAFVTMLLIQQARHSHLPLLQLNKESCASGLLHARQPRPKDGIHARTCVRDTQVPKWFQWEKDRDRERERGWLTTPFA